jgi:hypothetical protein
VPPLALPEVFAKLRQGLAGPKLVAASLYAEMRREAESDAYQAAKRMLV